MSIPSEVRKRKESWSSQQGKDPRQVGMKLVHDLSQPLATIENYLEDSSCLREAITPASRQNSIALVQDLCEPLTAIENYLEAMICLHAVYTPVARIKLGEVCEKSHIEVARVNEILRQLNALLRRERGNLIVRLET
jgi:signal transduction histidine kinase